MAHGTEQTNSKGGEIVKRFLTRIHRVKKGITLVELLIAVAIIGTLLAAFLPASTGTVAATGCPTCPPPAGEEKVPGTPNPAAVYCQQMGYQYDVREDEAGNQYDVCIFPDGSECDAWCFFKGKCGEDYSYCARKGYDTETELVDKGGYYTECAVCVSRQGGEETRIPMLELMAENGEPLIEAQPGKANGSCNQGCPECQASNIESSRDDRLPTTFDWRNVDGHTYIGPIRNQSTCGSCYAFAAAASAEGTYNWATGNYDDNCADFSESFIIWCLGRLPEYYYHFYGCDGADYDYYELEALTVEGICNESDYPYTVSDPGECTHWDDPRIVFSSWDRIPCNDIDAIKTAIMTYGVIDAAVLATSDFSAYSGGIYSDSNTSCYSSPCYYTPTNHAIALVGWGHDDTYGDYWLLRNSWGTSWGEDGYMRIAMTSALVACEATYLTWSTTLPPTIASVDPDSGRQGETLEVTIGGTYFTGASAVGFGDGIAVNPFTVASATQITANISISASATPGLRDVSVTTANGTGTLTDGFTVVAETGVTVSIDAPDEAAPDSDFTANVNISEVVGFDACNYDVSFDASVLRLDSVTSGLIGSTTIPVDMYNEVSPGTYRIIQNVPGLSGVSGSGYLAVLHFHVIGSGGDSSSISLSDGMLSDSSAEEIEATWVGDSVDITSVVPGDATGDGNVNALDITKVERIISGLDAETPGADATQDGNVNALDITKIEIIIAGLG